MAEKETRYQAYLTAGSYTHLGLKSRMESSLFAYYNDVVELLSGEELTEREEKLIEKRPVSYTHLPKIQHFNKFSAQTG